MMSIVNPRQHRSKQMWSVVIRTGKEVTHAVFFRSVVDSDGEPLRDIGVMIDYGISGGTDEKRTHRDGWVEFHNHGENPGVIWVHGKHMATIHWLTVSHTHFQFRG